MTQVNVQRGEHLLFVVQDRALIKQICAQPSANKKKKLVTVGELKKYVWGQPSRQRLSTVFGQIRPITSQGPTASNDIEVDEIPKIRSRPCLHQIAR
jgi:hypothetical protein